MIEFDEAFRVILVKTGERIENTGYIIMKIREVVVDFCMQQFSCFIE